MKNILIIAFSDLNSDTRVKRQINYLGKFYKIFTIGLEPLQTKKNGFYRIKHVEHSLFQRCIRALRYKLRHYEALYWDLYDFKPLLEVFSDKKFDLILANDVETLPLVFKISGDAKILLDTHEYAPKHFDDQFLWRFFFRGFNEDLCAKYLNRCDAIMTVTDGVANEYKRNYKINPSVITNAVDYVELIPSEVDDNHIRIITHGVANKNRRLEFMISIMDYIDDRFHLDLMLVPRNYRYYNYLKKMASGRNNVSVIPPVKQHEIISYTNSYDLSFLIFKPYTVNFKYGLGNKTFESIQARLGLVTGISPEPQAEIVRKYGCGIVLDSFDPKKIALQLNELRVDDIIKFKQKANIAAGKLTSVDNMKKLHKIVEELI